MKKEDIMRRISVALDSADGLTGDPVLQAELRADPETAKYAKDVTRIGKWLATWPLPEPDDAAFEALAHRIEQRFDESLATMSDPTAAPVFDDDDALRDATANLLNSGEFPLSDSSIELISDPSSPGLATAPESKPISPLAKVTLSKARAPAIVEESSGGGEPLSAAELELRLDGKPKKKKKKKATDSLAPKSSDRISIPTPKPMLAGPSLSPVVQLPRADDRKPAPAYWWFAAAAAVGLGVFGAATLFESRAAPSAESAQGSTLVTTGTIAPVAPMAASADPQALPITAAVSPPPPPETTVTEVGDLEAARADFAGAPVAHRSIAPPATYAAPARIAAGTGAMGGGGRGGDGVEDLLARAPGPGRRASTGATTTGATPTTPAPSPPREERPTTIDTAPVEEARARSAPAPDDTSALPSTPDRSTIQAVLAARTEAVRSCAAGAHGLADVDVVIAGSGRITTATVNGVFAGTPVGSCIARAVRGATFPPFSQPRFEVSYPFHL